MLLTVKCQMEEKGKREGGWEGGKKDGGGEEKRGTERQIKAHSWSMKTSKEAGPNWYREDGTR